jgi:Icc-related predicted phosphoesterase
MTTILIGHVSDLHGYHTPLGLNTREPDLWVWSGDMLKEDWNRPAATQPAVQHSYLETWGPSFAKWFMGKPVLVVDGNHDWIPACRWLQRHGIDARQVTTKKQEVLGFTYAGFPWIPIVENPSKDMNGKPIRWNHMRSEPELREAVDEVFRDPPDLLITHAPPAKILDGAANGGHYGISYLANRLQGYKPHGIKAHFFGHVHNNAGVHYEEGIGTLFVNSACRLQFVEVTK